MLRIGLTGGIGSGKSTVGKIFQLLGVQVYDADARAKWLMVNDESLKQQLTRAFGKETFDRKGVLNRKYLSEKVFQDKTMLKTLNAHVHPVVRKDFEQWTTSLDMETAYCIFEAALIFEGKSNALMDQVITVFCPEPARIERVVARDGMTQKQVLDRMNNQMPDIEKCKLSDLVIINDAKHLLIPQVIEIDNQLKALSSH